MNDSIIAPKVKVTNVTFIPELITFEFLDAKKRQSSAIEVIIENEIALRQIDLL